MTGNFIDSNRKEHGIIGYEVSATQHNTPFVDGWFIRSYSNTYSLDKSRISIRHYYGVKNRGRWTNIFRYNMDNYYTVEVYDTVEIDGQFFYRTIHKKLISDLKEAIHFANAHKSDT